MKKSYNKIFALIILCFGIPCFAQNEENSTQENNLLLPEQIAQQENLKVFAKLLQETGWDKALMRTKDEEYQPVQTVPPTIATLGEPGIIPQEKPYAYTVFAESDSVFAAHGITDAASLTSYLQTNFAYDEAFRDLSYDDQYQEEHHAANRFVSYHLLSQILRPEQMVYHYNETDFNLPAYLRTGVAEPTVPVYDYYVTMGNPRRLLKVYESKESEGVRLNRGVTFDSEVFQETEVLQEGISISRERMQTAQNGNIYFLDDLLLYNDQTLYNCLSERLRFDISSISPELMNMGYRRIMDSSAPAVYLTPDFLKNIKVFAGDLYYLSGFNKNWSDYQGDEMLLNSSDGNLDILITLPPVPFPGTYQIRLGLSGNSYRSFVQYYFGTEKDIQPVGLPIDERTNFSNGYISFGWTDSFVDTDLMLFQSGHMKSPGSYKDWRGDDIRKDSNIGRRIIGAFNMESDKTYYLRIKSVAESSMQLFLDYLEIVPRLVYNNPTIPENIW